MKLLLANAESWDWTQTDFVLILLCAGGIACVVALVGLILILARRVRHPHAAQLSAAAMFWGLIAIASILYAAINQLMWAKQNFLDLLSGYGVADQSLPRWPWIAWSILSAGYLALLVWTGLWR